VEVEAVEHGMKTILLVLGVLEAEVKVNLLIKLL
jgi:hypothetical protein